MKTVYCPDCRTFRQSDVLSEKDWSAAARKAGGYPPVRCGCKSESPPAETPPVSRLTEDEFNAKHKLGRGGLTDEVESPPPVVGPVKQKPAVKLAAGKTEKPYGWSMKLYMGDGTMFDFHCVASTEKTARRLALRKRGVREIEGELTSYTREEYGRVYGTKRGRA